jgi:MoaA/NifB/PqqE/SkfB family radical SAM enzyme
LDNIKKVKTDKYVILFDMLNGVETMSGINGHEDPEALDFPSMLDIGIMGTCHNNCEFCYQGDKKQPNMTLDNFKKIIDEASPHTMQCALGGRGDPNKHENFKDILQYCRDKRVVPNYTTSGMGITDEEIEISKACGAVAISLHDQEYTYKALEKFNKAGIKTNIHCILSSKSVVNATNFIFDSGFPGRIDGPWKRLRDYNINAMIFLLFKPQGRGKNLDWFPEKFRIEGFLRMCLSRNAEVKTPFKIGMDSCLVNHIKKMKIPLTEIQDMSIDTCEASRCSCYISPEMNMMPCSFCDHDASGQSILETSMFDVWSKGKEFVKVRKNLAEEKYECPYFK